MVQAPELVGAAGMNGFFTRSDQQTQRYEARL